MSGPESRYLFVKHSQNWNIDRCTLWMHANGKQVEWCYPVEGESFPDPSGYAGIVVFGGANSANDCSDYAWVKKELAFIECCLREDAAFFGICLGAQMLARVLGAKVTPHQSEVREVGFCTVKPMPDQSHFLSEPMKIMQWHSEGFELPSGTRCVATGDDFPNQAYQLNEKVYGVQFHPEVNAQVLAIWHERNKTRPSGVLTEQERVCMMADAHRYEPRITSWLDGFLSGWTQRCEQPRL